MDVGLILTTVLGILGQPLVKKAAETALEKAAEAAGKAGGEGVINTLLKFLRKEGQEKALVDAAKAPKDKKVQGQLRSQIAQLVDYDPDFLREITASIEQMPEHIRNEQIMRGKNIRYTDQRMTVEGGRQEMEAQEDIVGVNQEMTTSNPPKP